jgi:hypothetical protein
MQPPVQAPQPALAHLLGEALLASPGHLVQALDKVLVALVVQHAACTRQARCQAARGASCCALGGKGRAGACAAAACQGGNLAAPPPDPTQSSCRLQQASARSQGLTPAQGLASSQASAPGPAWHARVQACTPKLGRARDQGAAGGGRGRQGPFLQLQAGAERRTGAASVPDAAETAVADVKAVAVDLVAFGGAGRRGHRVLRAAMGGA